MTQGPSSTQGGAKIGLRRINVQIPQEPITPHVPGETHPMPTGEAVAESMKQARRNYIVDVETEALPDEELMKVLPPFDKDNVKLGNVKDPEKIKAKLEEAEAFYLDNARAEAAKSARTGRVLVIGVYDVMANDFVILEGEEKDLILEFGKAFKDPDSRWIGHNVKGFDIPFLWRRSMVHRIQFPSFMEGRYMTERIVDTMEHWKLFNSRAEEGGSSLDAVSRALGFEGKSGNGKDFAKLYHSKRSKAIDYVKNDLMRTYEIAELMGVL